MICPVCRKQVDNQTEHIELPEIDKDRPKVLYHWACWVEAGGR